MGKYVLAAMCLLTAGLFGAPVADLSRDGLVIHVEAEPEIVDPGRDVIVTVTVQAPVGVSAGLPDLRDRFSGFQVAEDFTEEPLTAPDGTTTLVSRWRLVPEPFAPRYRLAPFVVTRTETNGANRVQTFYTAPVLFQAPAAREPVTGGMEVDPKRDFPPLSWRLAGVVAAILAAAAGLIAGLGLVIRKIRTLVKLHRMSPIERALYELEALLRKGLPGRGFYKDFYVELTMVVRRYIERRHAVRAPNLTTGEFLRAAESNPAFPQAALAGLKQFLESADMVKFAGVEATPEMADAATGKARDYLETDNRQQKGGAA